MDTNLIPLVSPFVTLCLGIYGFAVAFPKWKKQKEAELKMNVTQSRYQAKIEACKAVWGLLAYMSERENEKTVFVLRGTQENTIKHLRVPQAEEFLKILPEVFYRQGHGIFLPSSIKEDLYNFRRQIFTLLEKEKIRNGNENELITLNNDHLWSEINNIRDRISKTLKDEILKNDIV